MYQTRDPISQHWTFVMGIHSTPTNVGTSYTFILDHKSTKYTFYFSEIQGSITSISPSPGNLLGSTSHDRFFRVHSTAPLSEKAGQQQEERGEVLGKHYMKSVPTAVVFDVTSDVSDITKLGKRRDNKDGDSDDDEDDDDEENNLNGFIDDEAEEDYEEDESDEDSD